MTPDKWKFLIDPPFKISAHCCHIMKKQPTYAYQKLTSSFPLIGTITNESKYRRLSYLKYGCSIFLSTSPRSIPIAFWSQQDIWNYIHLHNLQYSPIYNMGYERTGCMLCLFGVNSEKFPNRFQQMKLTHPKLYSYCLNQLNIKQILDYLNIDY